MADEDKKPGGDGVLGLDTYSLGRAERTPAGGLRIPARLTRTGVFSYQVVLRKNPDLSVVRALFRRVILSVDGVLSVPTLTLALDRATRTLSVDFEAVCKSGTIVVTAGDPAFVLPAAA